LISGLYYPDPYQVHPPAVHEIAAEMYLSPHTIRAQGKSIYRKLGAPSRSQAVARAQELGLLEG
jgi:LuxR family maltose regulon positive regulatory protein